MTTAIDPLDVLRTTLATGVAALSRIVAVPVGPLGFGRDLKCSSDITPTLEETDPQSPSGIGEATFRRYDCPRGALPPDAGKDSREYGIDIRGALNRGTTDADLNATGSSMRTEATKDDRVSAIPAIRWVPTRTGGAGNVSLEASITITPADPNLNPFSLTLAVDSASTLLLAIGSAT